ncbi:MAG TPA: phosphate acyltransferase PlsX [Micromonospora sp.]|nr:phosphate acyltransferase PlsX [Micromonospora sp.]
MVRAPWRLPGAPAPSANRCRAAELPTEPDTVRIAVDLLGGDGAPAVVVDGALRALRADPDLSLLLVGPPEVADEFIRALPVADRERVQIRPATPSRAARGGTTVHTAVAAVAEGEASALVSAGETGATVAAAALGLGRWPGVRRPALIATLPAVAGPVVLLDVGGSMEAGPDTLARHAALGAAYAAVAHGFQHPRVGLLSVGVEPGKGDDARRVADPALAGQKLPVGARYIGLVEGYDVSVGERADVVVTDGFTGNVLLKGIEGAYAMAGGLPTTVDTPRAAALLGVVGTVVACHGSAQLDDVASGIALAARLHRRGVTAKISTLVVREERRETEVTT